MQPDSPNPYQTPNFSDPPAGYIPPEMGNGLSPGILTQQRIVSILMIVHGTLCLLMGMMLLGMAFLLPARLAADMRRQGGAQPPNMEMILTVTYGVMALAAGGPGILQIYAGIQNFRLRGHLLGLIALGCGMFAMGSCYCLPTATALLVYGLIINLNDTTKRAFELAKQGHSYNEIMRMATQGRY